MIGLLDCNNFYVSCERLFNPQLLNKPVVILSNNDGCVISRSNEAKEIGIKMGEPFFRIKKLIHGKKVLVLSSNYTFYADISNRIMSILKKSLSSIEVYSIDEAFFILDTKDNKEKFCYELAKKILKWTGIPVSIGLAKTKTLAKVANRVIKKKNQYQKLDINYSNVLELNSNEKIEYVLESTDVSDIWGIGGGLSIFLKENKINNALELTKCNKSFIKKQKGIILLKTALELEGTLCHPIQEDSLQKKSICVSRSFGEKLQSLYDIRSALIVYVQKACSKMRGCKLFCKTVTIFLKTSKYQRKIYRNNKSYSFVEVTNDTRLIWKISEKILVEIYKKGFFYNKVGIILSGLCCEKEIQQNLFLYKKGTNLCEKKKKDIKVMNLVDEINNKFGYGKLRLSSDEVGMFNSKGKKKINWSMKSNYRSPCYTTNWYDIPKIKV